MYELVRIFSVIATVFALLIITVSGEAAKINVAVMPIDNNSDTVQTGSESIIYKLVSENMANQLITVFHDDENYDVIEREKVNKALTEVRIKIGEKVEQNQAIEVGKKFNAQCSVVGKIISAKVIENSEKKTLEEINKVTNQKPESEENGSDKAVKLEDFEGKITVELKFINNETGEVMYSGEIKGSQGGSSGASALRAACKTVAEEFIFQIPKPAPIETKTEVKTETVTEKEQQTPTEEKSTSDITVIYVDGDVLYIDKGNNADIKVGDIFLIFKEDIPITDMNGKVITVRTIKVGKALVTEVNDNHSICKIVERESSEADEIKRGCIAKKTTD